MKGKNSLFSGKMDVAIGDATFMPKTGELSRFGKYIANRPDKDPNGMFDVIAHGTTTFIQVESGGHTYNLEAREAAKLIRKQPGFKKAKSIRMLSCSTGADPEGFAQHLANALGKPVYAPNNTLYANPYGKHWVANVSSNIKGDFIRYNPGGIKHGRKK